ncbi:MAG: hypothetical protein R6U95_00555 [Bacteroidales bacterium]
MERSKYLVILFMVCAVIAHASYKERIYNAYISGNMTEWKRIIDSMEVRNINNADFIADLLNYQYGYIGYCIGIEDYDEAEVYLDKAYENVHILQKKSYKPAYVYAYSSAFYGFEIGINTYKAPVLGPRSIEMSKKAMSSDDFFYLGFEQYAHSLFYMPEIFGGSKTKAIEYYKKAEHRIEYQSLYKNWNYLSLLVSIAQAYEDIGELELAQKYYKKILQTEPGFVWVSEELYPELLQRIKKQNHDD